jgi:hypothetical protein
VGKVDRLVKGKTMRNINMESLKKAFDNIKDEFNDHLISINDNTNEIRQNYDYICEIDSKIEKMSEKIDEIMLFISDLRKETDSLSISLSSYEQKVFLVLYLEHSPLPFFEIVKRTQLPAAMVEKVLSGLIDKKIPLIVQKMEETELYLLEYKFKERQARENIIKIDEPVTKSLFVKDLNSFM